MRERAQGLANGRPLYDALLDEHEPELTQSRLDPLFAEIRRRLVPLVRQAQEATARNALKLEGRKFPEIEQWQLFRRMLSAVGFNFQRGRIDRSTHPFTMMIGGGDVRLTSRVDEHDVASGILATMHEVGHGIYDQGLVSGEQARLSDEAHSMALHEGLARLWENHIGRSRAFFEFLTPYLCELFPAAMSGIDAEQFFQAINVVRAGVSRVESDEMSYHLHIVLRYEIETALLSGQMSVRDLPSAWGERSASLLGIIPTSDRTGVLQDVHWAVGMFGYFPTYTLGSLYAAQLAEAYALEFPLQEEIRRGHFSGLVAWLTKSVFTLGSRIPAAQIVAQAIGRGLDTGAFFRHVESPNRAWNNPH
jgi:carboxypeptidase Taq